MTLNIIAENEQSKFEITDELSTLIHNAIYKAICMENIDFDCSVSLTYTDNDGIRELNREYRNKDSATDVLSFPMFDILNEEIYVLDGAAAELGDIVISLERAAEQAEEFGHSFEREVAFLSVHSVLHLLGYDHEISEDEDRIMREKQRAVMSALGLEIK
ncbi:MAG: rRNA maturation RNase YbeY [Ruminococcaceae bacterium]|nr:rRNA maturation RNase YbeY [Oscillospiraceae bacterium]